LWRNHLALLGSTDLDPDLFRKFQEPMASGIAVVAILESVEFPDVPDLQRPQLIFSRGAAENFQSEGFRSVFSDCSIKPTVANALLRSRFVFRPAIRCIP